MPVLHLRSYRYTKPLIPPAVRAGVRLVDAALFGDTLSDVQRVRAMFATGYTHQVIQDLRDTLLHIQQFNPVCSLHAQDLVYPLVRYPKHFIPPNVYAVCLPESIARSRKCDTVPLSLYCNARYQLDNRTKRCRTEETLIAFPGFKWVFEWHNTICVQAENEYGMPTGCNASDFLAFVHLHEIDREHHMDSEKNGLDRKELQAILAWIQKNRSCPPLLDGTWVIPHRLQCISKWPHFDALEAWAKESLYENPFRFYRPTQPDFVFTRRNAPKHI